MGRNRERSQTTQLLSGHVSLITVHYNVYASADTFSVRHGPEQKFMNEKLKLNKTNIYIYIQRIKKLPHKNLRVHSAR